MLAQSVTYIDPSRSVISTPPVSPAVSKQNPLIEAMHMMGATMSFPSETEIFGEGEAVDYAYQIVSGAVRTYKILSGGRRQVGGFYVPGDIFGLEYRDEHTLSAEAISDTKVVVVKRSMLMALAGRDPVIGRELLAVTGSELRAGPNPDAAAGEKRGRTSSRFSFGNGRTHPQRQCCRATYDAPRYRRLSWSDLRNRLPDVEKSRKCRCHRDGDPAPDRLAQSLGAQAFERLIPVCSC
jgi:hypothetical protein